MQLEHPVIKLIPLFGKMSSGSRLTLGLLKDIYPEKGRYDEYISGHETRISIFKDHILGRRWFAIENGAKEIVGGIAIWPEKNDGWVGRLYIPDKFRNQGYASAAISELERHAKNLGIKTLHAFIGHGNEPSITTFKKAGFNVNEKLHHRAEGKGVIFSRILKH
ncbi:MAG: GNAT family N-acetyltransferase [archaeon]|nr:GNAT family N-acetyltransferase [archaeon]